MSVAEILRLAHALAGVVFVSGMVGHWIVTGFIRRADSLGAMQVLVRTARPFGMLLTVGGITLTLTGVATAIALGRPMLGPLQGGHVDWMFVSVLLMLPLFINLAAVYPRKGRVIQVALNHAAAQGALTPALVAAWNDPILRAARTYELVAVTIVLILMIAKPF